MNKKELTELFKTGDFDSFIDELKSGRLTPLPDVAAYDRQIKPQGHEIFNEATRPNKIVTLENGNTRLELVARIALAFQKLIVNRAASFLFGNPVNLKTDDTKTMDIVSALKSVFADAKTDSMNKEIAKTMMSECEVAEYWHIVESDDDAPRYGFDSKLRIRCSVFSRKNGDVLYPYFDENRNLIAFSRQYVIVNRKSDKKKTFIETFTADEFMKFTQNDGGNWVMCEGFPRKNMIGKIPIIYGCQNEPEWADVQNIIERLEKLLSNFADTNDYHASPKIFVTGTVTGFAKKGETGAIIEGTDGATAQYLAWNNAPESVKTEIDILLKMIYTLSQTPDISFDNVKSLGSISGVALKLLFMDSHLKVQDKSGIYDEYLQRRINVVLAYLAAMNSKDGGFVKKCKTAIVTPVINPYMLTDLATEVATMQSAAGNVAVASRRTVVSRLGLVDDVDAELNEIANDEQNASMADVMTPMM